MNQTLPIAWNDAPDHGQIAHGFLNEESKLHFFNVSTLEIFPRALNEGPTSTLVSDGYLDDLPRTSRVRIRTFSAPRFTPGRNKQLTWKQPGWLPCDALGARPREPHITSRNDSSARPQQLERPQHGHRLGHHFDTLQYTEYKPSQQHNNFEWLFQANHTTGNSFDSVYTFSYTSYDDLLRQSSTDFSHAQHTGPHICSMWLSSCFSNTFANVLLLLLLIEIVLILSFIYYSILVQVKSQAHQTLQKLRRLSKAAISCICLR